MPRHVATFHQTEPSADSSGILCKFFWSCYPQWMKPLYVRPLTNPERAAFQRGLRSPDAFTLRRCQILLASADGQRPSQIAVALGCAVQTVRDALRAFRSEALACLPA